MKEQNGRENLMPLNIYFGQVIYSFNNPSNKYVVIDIKSGNTCSVAAVVNKDRTEVLGLRGGVNRAFIGEIDQEKPWQLNQVVNAFISNDPETEQEFLDYLKICSEKGSRILG